MLSYSKGRAFVVFLKWMVCFIVISQVVAGVFIAIEAVLLIRAGEQVSMSALILIASSPWVIVVGNTLAWIVFMFWELKTRGVAWGDALALRASPVWRFFPVVLLGLGAMTLLNDLDYYLDLLLPMPEAFKAAMAGVGNFDANPVGATLALVVMAPITEEYLCRGILLRGLLNRVAPWTAIVLSAVFFAVMHLNPWQAAGAFLIGLVLGWIYMRTRSVALCMAVHALNNAVALYFMNMMSSPDFDGSFATANPWWLNVVGVALLMGGAAWFWFLTRDGPPKDELAVAKPPPLPVVASAEVLVPPPLG